MARLQDRVIDGSHSRATTRLLLTEQGSQRLVVRDFAGGRSGPGNEIWHWQASEPNGVDAPTQCWGLPNDAKLRRSSNGRTVLLTTDSRGLAAVIAYPAGGSPLWQVALGHEANPHGIELLPNGNVAVAASTGNFVRIYTASRGPHSAHFVHVTLEDAHQVLWDDAGQTLWALGASHLVDFEVGGSPADPVLRRRKAYLLPTDGGHDLQPVTGEEHRLWVTTTVGVHQFVTSERAFDPTFPHAHVLDRSRVKSIGTDALTGTVLQTRPDTDDPEHWCTDTVDLFAGDERRSLESPGARIYRARWLYIDNA